MSESEMIQRVIFKLSSKKYTPIYETAKMLLNMMISEDNKKKYLFANMFDGWSFLDIINKENNEMVDLLLSSKLWQIMKCDFCGRIALGFMKPCLTVFHVANNHTAPSTILNDSATFQEAFSNIEKAKEENIPFRNVIYGLEIQVTLSNMENADKTLSNFFEDLFRYYKLVYKINDEKADI